MKMRPTLVALAIASATLAAPTATLAQDDSSPDSSSSSQSSENAFSSDGSSSDGSSSGSSGSSSSSSGSSSESTSSDAPSSGSSSSDDAMARSTNDSMAPTRALMKTVNEAYEALREVRAARMAIFNGHPEAAKKLVEDARKNLEEAQSLVERFEVPTGSSSGGQQAGSQQQASSQQGSGQGSQGQDSSQQASSSGSSSGSSSSNGSSSGSPSGGGPRYLPVDVSMIIAEGYLIPAQERQALREANLRLMRGDRVGAARVLRDASIEVLIDASLIPADQSLEHVRRAGELMGEDKLYEANMALKAIEDSVVSRTFGLDADPMQGGRGPSGGGSGSRG